MSRHLQRDMENLQRRLLSLCGKVEELVGKATRAFRSRNAVHAQEVVEADHAVDLQEVEIEEECLKTLALHQPVAVDLRRIATALKVNSDLERMADLAVNIAERTSGLVDAPEFPIPHALDQMAELTRAMVRRSLDAL
ncbi:MAG: phosphate transport system regulatory protein PhoU, partial [Planctomycetales bacterium]